MHIAEGVDHDTRASMLVRQLIDEHDPKFGVGFMSCSIYDTAWVSMVAKTTGEQTKWLFPWSFHYLLGHQQHDGGWATSGADGNAIMNTLAALLALCKHLAEPRQLIYVTAEELKLKKDRAIYFLEAKFSQWDVLSTTNQNFEILIPKLLQLLEEEGIYFSFPGRELLFHLNCKAAAGFDHLALYDNGRNNFTQFLEGFIGELDFDRIGHHKISGSMMASPASTAAYLMNSSKWDDEAEAYLTHVVSVGDETFNGGVPSQYPSTVFELTTTLTLLLDNGFKPVDLSMSHLDSAASFLEDCLALENGVTGFAPYVECDADNTARAISTLSLLGRTCSSQGLVNRFETREFFKTNTQDRNPSFRTNCLVLKALLDLLPQNREQLPQIDNTVKFITNCWWTTNERIEDSSNLSPNYNTLLMAQAFIRLVDLYDEGLMPVLNDSILRDKVFLCLFQALTRTMQTQNPDGSWGRGQRCETTAYALLTLIRLSALSSAPRVKGQIEQAIESGQKYLSKSFLPSSESDHTWNQKVSCSSRISFQAYVLAAMQAPSKVTKPIRTIENRFEVPLARIAIQTKYYSRQPWFAHIPEWHVQALSVETHMFLPQLKGVQYAVFPKDTLVEDKYFDSIAFVWIAAGAVDRRHIGPEYLFQMMILTFLNRQFEEYVTNVLHQIFSGCLFEIEEVIHSIFDELEKFDQKDQCFCDGHSAHSHGSSISTTGTISLSEARAVLYRHISHIMNHPYILMASHHDQNQLRSELLNFLLSRVQQTSASGENAGVEEGALAQTAGSSSPDQTAHQLTYAFLACVVGNQTPNGAVGLRRDFLDTPEQHYLVADLCRRLSILSFMSNAGLEGAGPEAPYREPYVDSRSVSFIDSYRDSVQSAVSSASSISSSYSDGSSPVSPVSSISSAPSRSPTREINMKTTSTVFQHAPKRPTAQSVQLNRLLSHERKCLGVCLESLVEADTNVRTLNILKMLVDFSELSEQMFRDPNVGSYHADVTHHDMEHSKKIGGTTILDPPPPPPKRRERKGSVSAARAALEVAPLQPRRQSPEENPGHRSSSQSSDCPSRSLSFSTAVETPARPSQDDIKLTGTSQRQREWNFNKTNSVMQNRKGSRSSIEISRIERIMTDIDGGKSTNPTLPIHPALRGRKSQELPTPKVNPMLPVHPAHRETRSNSEPQAEEFSFAHDQLDKKSKHTAKEQSQTADLNIPPLPSVGSHTSKVAIRKNKSDHRVQIGHEFEESQSQYTLKARPMQKSAKTWPIPRTAPPIAPPPAPKKSKARAAAKAAANFPSIDPATSHTSLSVQASSGKASGTGWVKAPAPVNNNGEAALEAERIDRMRKLRRASRLGGPRWRAPF